MASSRKASAPRLGLHIRTAAGLVAGARHAANIGCTTLQIMSGNPSAWNPGGLDPVQALKFRVFLDEHDLRPVFLHAGYLINLSCRKGRNAPIYAKSVKLLQFNMDRAADLSCEFVVVHLGSRRGQDRAEALEALIEGLGKLKVKESGALSSIGSGPAESSTYAWPMLLLENSAGSGDSVGSTIEELGLVLRMASAARIAQPLGICLDTAHLWGAGYDLTSAAAARRLVDQFDETVGVEHLHLVHVNDSPVPRGSARDRHEHIARGIIPVPALRALVRHPRLRHVAMLLETPGSTMPTDHERMDDLRDLAGVTRGKDR